MAIFNLFSKRQKALRGEVPEVFVYDKLPNPLKVQIVHLIKDTIGEPISSYSDNKPSETYEFIHNTLCREYGLFSLSDEHRNSDELAVLNYLLSVDDIEKALDIVELTFRYISVVMGGKQYYDSTTRVKLKPADAIQELNLRFREHGVGYQFESDEIIRVDSTYIHSEITKPVLTLLWNEKFSGANEEYLKAHEHYRHGRNKECLSDCLKAFESTMKIICSEKGWEHNQTDTASKLINVCFANNLIPSFTQNQFSSLQNLLTTGIPTIRNKVGGHGQGQVPQKVDDELTRYGLNLTGTNIIFLIEQSGL